MKHVRKLEHACRKNDLFDAARHPFLGAPLLCRDCKDMSKNPIADILTNCNVPRLAVHLYEKGRKCVKLSSQISFNILHDL